MAFLPVAWKAAIRSEPGKALRAIAARTDCRASGFDVRKAVAASVEALRAGIRLLGTAAKACRSIEDLASEAMFAGN